MKISLHIFRPLKITLSLSHIFKLSVDGNWGLWGSYGDCSVTCSLGVRTRTRTCSDPQPLFNGKQCEGTNVDNIQCDAGPCPSKCFLAIKIVLFKSCLSLTEN